MDTFHGSDVLRCHLLFTSPWEVGGDAFNVGVACLMELASIATSARVKLILVQPLAPFAPHLAEELWARIGEDSSVHTRPWPQPHISLLASQPVQIVVQIDGKARARIEVDPIATESQVIAAAIDATGSINTWRLIYIPGRIINLVTQR